MQNNLIPHSLYSVFDMDMHITIRDKGVSSPSKSHIIVIYIGENVFLSI